MIETKTKSLSDGLFNETKVYDERAMSQEDVKALDIMKGSEKIVNGHSHISLPWRNYPQDLPTNKVLAENRLTPLKKRLIKDEKLHVIYTSFMEDLVVKGHAQKRS